MALSEQEQKLLREIEQSLLADDPKFGAVVSDSDFGGSGGAFTLRGMAVVVIGLGMLVGGVALSQHSLGFITLSVAGFLVMIAGGVWMLKGGGSVRSAQKPPRPRARQQKAQGGSLGDRMEHNFRKRFEN